MKVVLDTNVLMSAIFFGGPPGQILSAWRRNQLALVMSPEIVDEYLRVAEVLFERYRSIDIDPILAILVQNAGVVPCQPLPRPTFDDPDDDKFLACGLASGAEAIISGDKKLRAVSGYGGMTVICRLDNSWTISCSGVGRQDEQLMVFRRNAKSRARPTSGRASVRPIRQCDYRSASGCPERVGSDGMDVNRTTSRMSSTRTEKCRVSRVSAGPGLGKWRIVDDT